MRVFINSLLFLGTAVLGCFTTIFFMYHFAHNIHVSHGEQVIVYDYDDIQTGIEKASPGTGRTAMVTDAGNMLINNDSIRHQFDMIRVQKNNSETTCHLISARGTSWQDFGKISWPKDDIVLFSYQDDSSASDSFEIRIAMD
jgi:hypothetical protein